MAAATSQISAIRSESKVLDSAQQIVSVARRIKEEIRKCSGISLRPLNAHDVSLESARRIIPPSLYWLVRKMITSDENGVDDFERPNPCVKIEDEILR